MMPAIPLPFVVALVLAILLARLALQRNRQLTPAIVFVGAVTILSVLTGLYWNFHIPGMGLVRLVAASLVPPIAWFCFARLTESWTSRRLWLGLLPLAAAMVLGLILMRWLDVMLAALFLGYGAVLVRMGLRGSDDFGAVRLGDVKATQKAALAVGAAMVGSGTIDLLIGLDFRFQGGAHVVPLVAIANVIALPVAAYAAIMVGNGVSAPESVPDEGEKPVLSTEDDARIVDLVAALMRQKALFRDPDLTLNRLARQVGIPARQISAAINRVQGRSVSQMVNEYRIAEARRLLKETDLTVTQVMLESGFQTKSNFNREFLRTTGMTPSDFRRTV
ncbi:MAG TPA: AraC family transcriptional regulator [Rhizomicrobium sp.]|nr:AraC family transcriptional regulator [Rhizomicrobium sp.]